jgi:hypothetical protein
MRKIIIVSLLLGLSFCLLVGLYYFMLFDPFGWGIVQSSRFTWESFASVKRGEPIEAVVNRLGEPVRKPEEISVMTTTAPCVNGGCKEYIFAGADWGASYKEAIVIVDRTGRVLYAIARQE